jgi:hypothetical protein
MLSSSGSLRRLHAPATKHRTVRAARERSRMISRIIFGAPSRQAHHLKVANPDPASVTKSRITALVPTGRRAVRLRQRQWAGRQQRRSPPHAGTRMERHALEQRDSGKAACVATTSCLGAPRGLASFLITSAKSGTAGYRPRLAACVQASQQAVQADSRSSGSRSDLQGAGQARRPVLLNALLTTATSDSRLSSYRDGPQADAQGNERDFVIGPLFRQELSAWFQSASPENNALASSTV